MVKGVSRNVIVVESPDPALFESAIFIVRDEAFSSPGMSRERVLREAGRIAGAYVAQRVPRRRRGIPAYGWVAVGAAAAAAIASVLYLLL